MSHKPNDEQVEAMCFEQLARAVAPVDVPTETRRRLWAKISAAVAAPEPAGTTTSRAGAEEWIALGPLVKCRLLRVDAGARSQTVLIRAEPGGRIPRHRHAQDEECIVLEGECHIGDHHLRAGDAHFAALGSWHDDITTRIGALVLVRGEYPAPAFGE
jgi:quercetin dioxygenase-like cupin family protein